MGQSMFRILLILLTLFPASLLAQPDTLWVRCYEGAYRCFDLKPYNESGFVWVGDIYTLENVNDFYMMITDSLGRQVFDRRLIDPGPYNDPDRMHSSASNFTISEVDSSFYLVGYFGSPADGAGLIARVSMEGDSLWMYRYGGLRANLGGSCSDDSGGIFVSGRTGELAEYGSIDGYLLNVDAEGEERWYRVYGGEATDAFSDMIRTQDGGFALVGKTSSFGGGGQFYLVKTDSLGEEEWSGAYGDSIDSDIAVAIGEMPDGGFVMAGWTYPEPMDMSTDMLVIRVDAEGEEIWRRYFGDNVNSETFHDLVVLENGDIVLLGETSNSPDDAVLIRLNPEGEVVWEVRYDIAWGIDCYALAYLSDGSYAFAGAANGRGRNGAFLARTEPDPANAVWDVDPSFPSLFTLHPAYPNPFNSTTSLRFDLPHSSHVSITLTDLTGRQVATLLEDRLTAGRHRLTWNAKDYPAGMYLCRLQAGSFATTRKMIIIK